MRAEEARVRTEAGIVLAKERHLHRVKEMIAEVAYLGKSMLCYSPEANCPDYSTEVMEYIIVNLTELGYTVEKSIVLTQTGIPKPCISW